MNAFIHIIQTNYIVALVLTTIFNKLLNMFNKTGCSMCAGAVCGHEGGLREGARFWVRGGRGVGLAVACVRGLYVDMREGASLLGFGGGGGG